jgi:hypothetical protein
MKNLIVSIVFLSLSNYSYAQITENRNSMIEGFISGCKKHKDIQLIYQHFGKEKGELIINSYCKCRAHFFVNNLTFKQAENIYYGKEKMKDALFQKMEFECTSQLDGLIK